MKSILIASDFSSNVTHAVVYGYRLASKLGTDITLAQATRIIPLEIPQSDPVAYRPICAMTKYRTMAGSNLAG